MTNTTYICKLYLPSDEISRLEGYLNADSEGQYQGMDSAETHSVKFPDGFVMDIKVCGCDDEASWSEAVMLAPTPTGALCEIGCTEPGETILSDWEFTVGNRLYRVIVEEDGYCKEPYLSECETLSSDGFSLD